MKRWRLATQLLSCVSIFALGTVEAAAHEGDCLKLSAPTTINTNKRCVRVEKTVSGDVVNNATIGKGNAGEGEGDGNAERRDPGFFIGDCGVIGGKLVNNGTIVGGSSGVGALTLGEDADVVGGIFNNGTIASKRGSGISLGLAEYDDHRLETQAAALNGDIVNAGLISGKDYGVVARYGTMSGALNNQQNGVIRGGSVGVYIPDTFTSWTGGIKNSGAISGDFAGILIGNWGLPNAVYNDDAGEGGEGHQSMQTLSAPQGAGVVFSGGIFNYAGGTIVSEYGPSIGIAGASFSGGVYNNGLITQVLDGEESYSASLYRGVGVVFAAPTVEGGLTNDTNGEIYGLAGPAVWITDMTRTFSGGIHNLGVISGATDGIRIESASFSDGLTNGASGSIAGAYGDGVFATSAWTGGVLNDGLITGSRNGFTYDGTTFAGGFVNNGTITGGNTAVSMLGQSFDGGFANSGLIEGEYGDGVSIRADTWGSVEARANIVNEESGVIRGGATGFYLSAGSVYGDFLNDGSISGDGTDTGTHLIADLFDGNVTNHGEIESAHNALRLDFGTFDGAFSNSGTISGGDNGAILSLGTMTGSFTNSGLIEGEYGNGVSIDVETWGSDEEIADILNTVDGVITGGDTGFQFDGDLVFGSFTNDGSISGGTNGAVFEVDEFNAPVKNTGTISGGTNGLVMELTDASGGFTNSGEITGESGTGVSITAETWGSVEARADIINEDSGVIHGGATGFYLSAGSVYGDFLNDGTISGDGEDTGVHLSADLFDGNVTNHGKIERAHNALRLDFGTFDGSFSNSGTISGGDNGAILSLGTMTGGFTNSGLIEGEYGDGVLITAETWGSVEARADIINEDSGVIHGGATGFYLSAGSVYGDFQNDGTISGDGEDTGVHLSADLFDGNVTNHGEIESAHNALRLDFGTFDGSFSNSGTISGGDNGAILSLGSMTGSFTNSGLIEGEYGNGVSIDVETWGSDEEIADILNTVDGVITGGDTGFQFDGELVFGSFTNDGSIAGGTNGAVFEVDEFNAPVKNTGTISGGANGLVMELTDASGGFTNSGEITGESGTGVSITAETWGSVEARADIINEDSGVIHGGETGFYLSAGDVHGDFVNDGTITGGGEETGIHLIAGTFDGDVINNGLAQAASNALHLEFGTLTGVVRNTGTIEATDLPGTAVLLEIGNGAEFTNTGGGLIKGDVKFAGNAAYAFVAGEGGIEGSLLGVGGDDTISVRGAHYFVGGTANNFASFTVEDGGLALMGARSEGGSSAGGYSFASVAALNVQNGGTLYLDKATVLEVGTYNQEAGSVAEFFLGAPSGISGLTGDVTAGQGDYGRILVSGSATLNGTIAGLLDPLFNSANAGLQSIRYNDVLVANGGINGDFSSVALIANSSLFQMNSVVDGNTIDVTVARTSLGDVSDVPGIIVNLGGPFDSMVSDRSNGVGSSSCGLAGEGWCLNRFAQNDATQVMTDASPVDPFDWLRTGMRNVGETAVWGRGIGSWGASDGWNGSKGSKFSLSGVIVGVDYVFERDLMAGVAAQWTTADVDFKGTTDNANVENFELGAYASFGDARLYLNTNASAIWHSIDVERFSNGGGHATASYSGTTLSAFAEAGKIFETEEGVRMGPFLSLSLTHLDTDPYLEAGTGPLLYVRGARLDSLKSTMGMRIAYPIALGSGRKFVPEARLGWSHEFMDDQASFRASVQGQNKAPSIILGEKFARDTAIVGGGVTVPLSDSTNLYADYDAGLNPDITTHTVSVGLRTSW